MTSRSWPSPAKALFAILVALSISLGLSAPSPARAAWYDPVPHPEQCRQGEFLVGMEAQIGEFWGPAKAFCAPWIASQAKFGDAYSLGEVGGWNSSTYPAPVSRTAACPLYAVVTAITYDVPPEFSASEVQNVRLDCARPSSPQTLVTTLNSLVPGTEYVKNAIYPPGMSGAPTRSDCPAGKVAIGVNLITGYLDPDTGSDTGPLETILLICADPAQWTARTVRAADAVVLGIFKGGPPLTGPQREQRVRAIRAALAKRAPATSGGRPIDRRLAEELSSNGAAAPSRPANGGVARQAVGDSIPGSPTVAGDWETSQGSATFTQSGGRLEGSYKGGSGRISAQGGGSNWTGYWMQATSGHRCPIQQLGSYYWGRMAFTFTDQNRRLDGHWSYCDASPSAGDPWTGHRVR